MTKDSRERDKDWVNHGRHATKKPRKQLSSKVTVLHILLLGDNALRAAMRPQSSTLALNWNVFCFKRQEMVVDEHAIPQTHVVATDLFTAE